MYSRRSHRNSHHGCRECKQRRVKCDETQPKCLRCKSKGRTCTYTHLLSQYNPFSLQETQQHHQQKKQEQHPEHQLHVSTPDNPYQQRLVCRANRIPAPRATTRADHILLEQSGEIFHHYTHVVVTIHPEHHLSEQFWRWDRAVRAFAPSHDFLYFAALTFASLHRSLLYQQHAAANAVERARHVALASAYQARALEGFAPAVARLQQQQQQQQGGGGSSRAGEGDADALLTCSSIILASAFVFPPAPGEDVLDQAGQVIRLFYGTHALYKRTWEAGGPDSEIGAFVRERVRAAGELGDGAPAPEAEESLGRVLDRVLERATAAAAAADFVSLGLLPGVVERIVQQQQQQQQGVEFLTSPFSETAAQHACPQGLMWEDDPLSTFLPPITALRLLFRRLVVRPRLHTMALEWPASLPKSFLVALERRDPLALVVLAHWAKCLEGFKHLWWVSRWGTRVIRAVVNEVCEEGTRGEVFGADPVSGADTSGALGGREAAEAGGAEGAKARAGVEQASGTAAGAWRPCLEWPARGLGDAVATYWHR